MLISVLGLWGGGRGLGMLRASRLKIGGVSIPVPAPAGPLAPAGMPDGGTVIEDAEDLDTEERYQTIVQAAQSAVEFTIQSLLSATGLSKSTVQRALKRMIKDGLAAKLKHGRYRWIQGTGGGYSNGK
jgi:hypothetical protein